MQFLAHTRVENGHDLVDGTGPQGELSEDLILAVEAMSMEGGDMGPRIVARTTVSGVEDLVVAVEQQLERA